MEAPRLLGTSMQMNCLIATVSTRKKWKNRDHWWTLFDSWAMHSSNAERRAAFFSFMSPPRFDASMEHCIHLRRCLIISLIEAIIATDACSFDFWARCVIELMMSICIVGWLATFLWSKCLTKNDNIRCMFCPAIELRLNECYNKNLYNLVDKNTLRWK